MFLKLHTPDTVWDSISSWIMMSAVDRAVSHVWHSEVEGDDFMSYGLSHSVLVFIQPCANKHIGASGPSRKTPWNSCRHIHRQINTELLQAERSRKLVWHDHMKINIVNTVKARIMKMKNMCTEWSFELKHAEILYIFTWVYLWSVTSSAFFFSSVKHFKCIGSPTLIFHAAFLVEENRTDLLHAEPLETL